MTRPATSCSFLSLLTSQTCSISDLQNVPNLIEVTGGLKLLAVLNVGSFMEGDCNGRDGVIGINFTHFTQFGFSVTEMDWIAVDVFVVVLRRKLKNFLKVAVFVDL